MLLIGASAAAPTPERAVARARAAIDAGKYADAIQLIDATLAAHGRVDVEAVWTLRVMRVEARLAQGDRSALKDMAGEFPRKYQNSQAAVRRLMYLAGPGEQARLFEEAAKLAEGHGPGLASEVQRAKAFATRAEQPAREAIRLARLARDRELEARALVALAYVLTSLGRPDEAVEAGERALTLARLPNTLQNVQGNLGWAYFELGDYDAAAEMFTKAEATAARIGNAMNRAVWFVQLANCHFQKREWAAAERYNRLAFDPYARPHDRGYALANLARINIELGQYDKARELNRAALEAKRQARDEEAERSSIIIEARILAAKERKYAEAEKLLLRVTRETKQHLLDAQTQLAKLYVLAKPELAQDAFNDALKTARAIRGSIEPAHRLTFFNTTEEMLDAYIDFLIDRGRDADALAVAEASRAESLEEGRVTARGPFNPQAIARKNGAVVLSYWLGRKRSYLWQITAAGMRVHHLPADTLLQKQIASYQRQLLRPGLPPFREGQQLYDTLVGKTKIGKGARVVVVADGPLHLLNFETLVVPGTQRYWIDDVTLSSSASLQLLDRASRAPSPSPSMLLVGNTPSPDPVAYPPLKEAAAEMRAIARRFPNHRMLDGERATPSAYRAASPGSFDYLHFVAHGVAAPKDPLESFIVLAPENGSYKLVARDVEKIALNARLVTISSCEGAGKRTYAGEGIVGLAWVFQRAGADRVIAALWKVSDAATATLMDQMYAGIGRGEDPAVALRNAKLKLIRERKARPVHWAGFVLYAGT